MGFSRLYIIDMDIIQMTNTEQITNENWNEEGKAEMLAEWIEHKYDGDMFEMANKINELLTSQKQQILDAVQDTIEWKSSGYNTLKESTLNAIKNL